MIRLAFPEDEDAVLALIRAVPELPQWGRDALAIPGSDEAAGGPVRRLLVADDGGKVAGFAQIATVLDEAELESIVVRPDAQRRGLGRQLLMEVLAIAQADGARTVHLEVRGTNQAALRLYRSAGFSMVGTRFRYYSDPAEDAVLLRCVLPWDD